VIEYYRSNDIVLYQADCLELLPLLSPEAVDLLLTDPPYGINLQTNYASRKRGRLAKSNDYAPVHGDDKAYDPAPLLAFKRLILFGANYYADKLPPSPSWIVWDKRDGLSTKKRQVGFCDSADVELAWTNLGGPARIIYHRWMGMLKASEKKDKRVHPTQKPAALMEEIIAWRTNPGDLILDPYCGAGATLVAAQRQGRRAIGIEISPQYCEITAQRLKQDLDRAEQEKAARLTQMSIYDLPEVA
jgi:site-specific DNA-methyltransferase (adenine-specific)